MLNRIRTRTAAALASCALALAAAASLALVPPAAAQSEGRRQQLHSLQIPVAGTLDQAPALGTLTVQRFVQGASDAQPVSALASLVLRSANRTAVTRVTLPVNFNKLGGDFATAQIACEILDLSLAPLDLDLLGLVVHLDEVNLDITAVPGAGNLLGNLLCAITGLLDPGLLGDVGLLLDLLNQVLGLLS